MSTSTYRFTDGSTLTVTSTRGGPLRGTFCPTETERAGAPPDVRDVVLRLAAWSGKTEGEVARRVVEGMRDPVGAMGLKVTDVDGVTVYSGLDRPLRRDADVIALRACPDGLEHAFEAPRPIEVVPWMSPRERWPERQAPRVGRHGLAGLGFGRAAG